MDNRLLYRDSCNRNTPIVWTTYHNMIPKPRNARGYAHPPRTAILRIICGSPWVGSAIYIPVTSSWSRKLLAVLEDWLRSQIHRVYSISILTDSALALVWNLKRRTILNTFPVWEVRCASLPLVSLEILPVVFLAPFLPLSPATISPGFYSWMDGRTFSRWNHQLYDQLDLWRTLSRPCEYVTCPSAYPQIFSVRYLHSSTKMLFRLYAWKLFRGYLINYYL